MMKYTATKDIPCGVCSGVILKGSLCYRYGDWKGHEPHVWQHLSHVDAADPSPPRSSSVPTETDDLLEAAKHAAMEWRLHGQLTDSCRHLEAAIAKRDPSYTRWDADDTESAPRRERDALTDRREDSR